MKTKTLITLFGTVVLLSSDSRTLADEAKAAAQPPTPEAKAPSPDANSEAVKVGATNDSVVIRQYAILRYKVEEDPKLGDFDELRIDSLGEASFKISHGSEKTLPPMKVSGRTLDEVKKEIKAALDKDYYVNCTVRLSLDSNGATPGAAANNNPQATVGRVLFIGALRGPVMIPPGTKKMISDAVMELPENQYANLSKVEIERYDPVTKTSEIIKVDVNAILKKGKRDKDVELRDGDHVRVPEKFLMFN
jgi:protein involved in polysaccharide export with SLBB domain